MIPSRFKSEYLDLAIILLFAIVYVIFAGIVLSFIPPNELIPLTRNRRFDILLLIPLILAMAGLYLQWKQLSALKSRVERRVSEINSHHKRLDEHDEDILTALSRIDKVEKLSTKLLADTQSNKELLSQLASAQQEANRTFSSSNLMAPRTAGPSLNEARVTSSSASPKDTPVPAYRLNEPTTSFLIGSSPSPSQEATRIPTQNELRSQLTHIVYSRDKQQVRALSPSQVNITRQSENDLALGRVSQTQLELTNAGGSYLLFNYHGELLLYPTEQTLKLSERSVPIDGLYNYESRPIQASIVLSPAILKVSGTSLWCVEVMGSIAIPG